MAKSTRNLTCTYLFDKTVVLPVNIVILYVVHHINMITYNLNLMTLYTSKDIFIFFQSPNRNTGEQVLIQEGNFVDIFMFVNILTDLYRTGPPVGQEANNNFSQALLSLISLLFKRYPKLSVPYNSATYRLIPLLLFKRYPKLVFLRI